MMLTAAIAALNETCEQMNQIAEGAAGGRRHSQIAGEEDAGAFSAVARC